MKKGKLDEFLYRFLISVMVFGVLRFLTGFEFESGVKLNNTAVVGFELCKGWGSFGRNKGKEKGEKLKFELLIICS